VIGAPANALAQRLRENSHMPTTFQPMPEASSFRRTAAAMWSAPADPSIHGSMDIDATAALAFIEAHRARTGEKLSITHLVCHAVAQAYRQMPELNAKVRFGGRLERRETVDPSSASPPAAARTCRARRSRTPTRSTSPAG
jgi:pyruvate/2-oxoglutarate dehydrogenase complex dihydrolipoamide acyltransferase (E2) component